MNTYEKIRAALEASAEFMQDDNAPALDALAELERAAVEPVEPVAWIIGKPTHGHEIGRYLAWNAGHVPYSVGFAAEPLYTAPPPAPVAEMREPTEGEGEEIYKHWENRAAGARPYRQGWPRHVRRSARSHGR